MLNVTLTSHREFLPADTSDQRLFLMLKLRPDREVSASRPPTAFSFVIDTSGSMDEVVVSGKTKRDIVIDSLYKIIRSGRLSQNDRLALVQFNDQASTLIGLTPATEIAQLDSAIAKLNDYSGGTCMGRGMTQALSLLQDQEMASRRTLIFTDGQTFDEMECRDLSAQFAHSGIPITALGVGEEYNEELLLELSDITGGHRHHIVSGSPIGFQVPLDQLPETLFAEVQQAQQEVITNLALSAKTVKGVKLERITRVYPDQAEFALTGDPYPIGAAQAHDDTVFILEFSVDSRPASRMRIAQLGLTYDIPGLKRRGELPPQNVIVQFVAGGGGAAQVDPEVMHYVQQRNIAQLVNDATRVVEGNPQEAEKMLETARRMTVKIGNQAMLESLNQGIEELRKTRKISAGTRKTVKMGAKGKTVKMNSDDVNAELSEEQIRKISGT